MGDEREGGERRRVMLMFSDVASSTQIAGRLDPEEWRELLANYHTIVAESVSRYGGHVAKYLGDGVLVYFGWPVAHESDGERAALAGHAIFDGIAKANLESAVRRRPPLEIRIGIHLGEVVISRSGDVYGDAANVAARVQAIAEVGKLIVTEPVYRAIGGRLAANDVGTPSLRGVDRPIRLYEVASPESDLHRTPAPATSPSAPFVGRARDLEVLLEAWQQVRGGMGRLISVVGEAGIGKSRLLQEFRARIAGDPHLWLSFAGSEIFRGTPYFPLSKMLRQVVRNPAIVSPASTIRRVARLLRFGGVGVEDANEVIERLVASAPSASDVGSASAIERRSRVQDILCAWAIGASRRRPTILVLEDVHWFDPSTLDAVAALARAGAEVPLLIVLLARPEFVVPWPREPHHGLLTLSRLDNGELRAVIEGTLSGTTLTAGQLQSIVSRSSGIPLFAEELARFISADAEAGRGSEVPDTLAGSLNARLDRLGGAREIAQVAAVIGDEFDPDLLSAVIDRPVTVLEPLLRRLVDMDILAQSEGGGMRAFNFRHGLLRDAAYEMLLRSDRRDLHAQIAGKILEIAASTASSHPEIVARHWASGGEAAKAAAAWYQAGVLASARGGYREAEQALQQALDNLATLPESRDNDLLHWNIREALVLALQVTEGYSAQRTIQAAERLKELADRLGSVEQMMTQTAGLWVRASSSGRFADAAAFADQFANLARRDGRPDSVANSCMMQMTSRYRLGDLLGAEQHFLVGEPHFDLPSFRNRPGSFAQTYGNAARNAWMLGRPAEARRRMMQAIEFGNSRNSAYDLAFVQYMAAILCVLMREPEDARKWAERSIELSDTQGFPQFAAISRVALGRALVDLDPSSAAIDSIQRGIDGIASVGSRVAMTLYLAWLAEAQAVIGATDDARATIVRAMLINPEERFFWPELLRLRGELEARAGDRLGGISYVREALTLANRMQARTLQLRAAISLYRMLQRDGAHAVLATAARHFGDDTGLAEFKDAQAILLQRG